MSRRVTISFPEDDEKLLEWVDKMVEERHFRDRSDAMREGIRHVRERMRRDRKKTYDI